MKIFKIDYSHSPVLKLTDLFNGCYLLAPNLRAIWYMWWENCIINWRKFFFDDIAAHFTEHPIRSSQFGDQDSVESMYVPKYFILSEGYILWPLILTLKSLPKETPGLWNMISSVLVRFKEILFASNHFYKDFLSKNMERELFTSFLFNSRILSQSISR